MSRYSPRLQNLERAEPVDEFAVPHPRRPQTAAGCLPKDRGLRLHLQEARGRTHVQAVTHLLPGQWLTAVHAVEDVQPGLIGRL